jgi:hypothetical protein
VQHVLSIGLHFLKITFTIILFILFKYFITTAKILENTLKLERNIKMLPSTNNPFSILVYYFSVLFSWLLLCMCMYRVFVTQFSLNASHSSQCLDLHLFHNKAVRWLSWKTNITFDHIILEYVMSLRIFVKLAKGQCKLQKKKRL